MVAMSMMAFLAGASTVTLTGSCYSNVVNQTNNYIIFNLANSGNGTATNLLIEPIIEGASTSNATLLIPLVAPGGRYSEKIYLSNFTMPGSYAERFVARYSQGSSTFTTLFPCIVNIETNAQSLIGITGLSAHDGILDVNMSNIADYPILANISIFAPPSFSFPNGTRSVTVNQYSVSNTSFTFSSPKYSNAEFPVAVAVSYASKGVHYSTLAITAISYGSSGAAASQGSSNILLIAIGLVIAAVLALIVASVFVNRRRRMAQRG